MADIVSDVRGRIDALLINPVFLADEKWQKRLIKAIEPIDVDSRVKSQLYTAATKELDTAAMAHYRRTGEHKNVTEEDIEVLFQEKWAKYLEKKAEKKAKQKAFAKAD